MKLAAIMIIEISANGRFHWRSGLRTTCSRRKTPINTRSRFTTDHCVINSDCIFDFLLSIFLISKIYYILKMSEIRNFTWTYVFLISIAISTYFLFILIKCNSKLDYWYRQTFKEKTVGDQCWPDVVLICGTLAPPGGHESYSWPSNDRKPVIIATHTNYHNGHYFTKVFTNKSVYEIIIVRAARLLRPKKALAFLTKIFSHFLLIFPYYLLCIFIYSFNSSFI